MDLHALEGKCFRELPSGIASTYRIFAYSIANSGHITTQRSTRSETIYYICLYPESKPSFRIIALLKIRSAFDDKQLRTPS